MSTNDDIVIAYLKDHPFSTTKEVSDATGIKYNIVSERLNTLFKFGILDKCAGFQITEYERYGKTTKYTQAVPKYFVVDEDGNGKE